MKEPDLLPESLATFRTFAAYSAVWVVRECKAKTCKAEPTHIFAIVTKTGGIEVTSLCSEHFGEFERYWDASREETP